MTELLGKNATSLTPFDGLETLPVL